MARHLSGSVMDAALGADKRYLVRCAYKIGCLLRACLELEINHIWQELRHVQMRYCYNVFTLYLLKRQVHQVKYSELVNSVATETELQEQLVGGDMTTITMRIPRNLKEAGAEVASLRGISFSAFIRMCMIEELSKRD
jgi:hypothetical protein